MTDLQALGAALGGLLVLYILIFGIVFWFRIAKADGRSSKLEALMTAQRQDANVSMLDICIRLDAVDGWIQKQAALRSTNGRFTKRKK